MKSRNTNLAHIVKSTLRKHSVVVSGLLELKGFSLMLSRTTLLKNILSNILIKHLPKWFVSKLQLLSAYSAAYKSGIYI